MKILIIEDEKELAQSILSYLAGNGLVCDLALDFDTADQMIHLYEYDCIVVDITLPDGSGLDVIRSLKAEHSLAGVIIISAKNALDDKLSGLQIGADDYLSKPFHLAELKARIMAVIRRRWFEGKPEITFNEIRINPDEHQALVLGKPADLTKKEFGLLLYMISNKGKTLTRESIAEHLWGSNIDLVDSFDFIYSHIKNLRKKLLELGAKDYIQTVYGIGYRFGEL
jgi:DNA-binding response OmpR family regulator